eukprot:m.271455 g.271455  ORF g.271455 m.271455 type:complete len:397 (+) comp54778_c0_seq3:275-1465(+)
MLVHEAGGLNLLAVHTQRVVVKKLLVQVWAQRSRLNAVSSAHFHPGLHMALIDLLSDTLHVELRKLRHHGASVVVLDAKQICDDFRDGTLGGVALVCEVVCLSEGSAGGHVPEGSCNILNVHSVQTQLVRPQQLHGLAALLVDSTNDEAGSDAKQVSGSVDNGGANDDVLQPRNLGKLLLNAELVLCNACPGLGLVSLIAGTLVALVNLCCGELDELDTTLGSLCCVGNREVVHILAVDQVILPVLGNGCTVNDNIELGAILVGEGLHNCGLTRQVALLELHLREGSLLARIEVCGLWQHLVNDTDEGGEIVLDEVDDKVAADEAGSAKDEDACGHWLLSGKWRLWWSCATGERGLSAPSASHSTPASFSRTPSPLQPIAMCSFGCCTALQHPVTT